MTVSFAQQSITRLRAGAIVDDYGDTIQDWTSPDELEIAGCVVHPVFVEEVVDPTTDSVIRRQWVGAPAGSDIVATDRVRYGGRVYRVDGEPAGFETGVLDHIELTMTEVTG